MSRMLPALGFRVALALAPPAGLAAQAHGYLVGTVRDDVSGARLEGAIVSILGTEIAAVTDAEGRFLLEGVPAGEVSLRATLADFTSIVEPIDVSATEVGLLNIRLRPIAVVLDDLLVVSGRRSPGAAASGVEVSGTDDPFKSALDLLEEEVPGLDVRRKHGEVSGGAVIRVRGVGSFRNNAPAIYVDGVRVDDRASGFQTPRLLEQIPADAVIRIRVLRGPSAASAYAFGANGVILIETRTGGPSRQ